MNTKTGKLTREARNKIDERLKQIFTVKRLQQQSQKSMFATMKQKKLANKYHAMGLDHALRIGLGVNLVAFRPSVVPRPLHRRETRCLVDMKDLPPEIARVSGDRVARSIVRDETNNKWRMEVSWGDGRMSIHQVLDMGSIGWPSKFAIYDIDRGCLRGCWECDPAHRSHDNCLTSLQASGLQWAKLEVILTAVVLAGPFNGAAFFGSFSEAADEYFDAFSPLTCPLFDALYGKLTFQLHAGRLPVHFGTADHRMEMWERARSAWPLHFKGTKSKQGRWFQLFDRPSKQLPFWACMELVLTYMGAIEGWFGTEDPPSRSGPLAPLHLTKGVVDGAAAAASTAAAQTEAGAGSLRRTVAESNKDVEALRAGARNTMHLGLAILNRSDLRALWMLVTTATQPIVREHGRFLVMQKTMEGSKQWLIEMSQKGYESPLLEVFDFMRDDGLLVACGLKSFCDFSSPFLFGTETGCGLVSSVFGYAVELIGSQLQWLMRHSHALPGLFYALLSPKSEPAALATLRRWWDVLQNLERSMLDSVWLQQYHSDLIWPKVLWVREVLVGLSECRFERVPADLRSELEAVAMGFRSTKIVEDGFNMLRDRGRHHKSSRQGAALRFANLVSSSLMADSDRRPVKEVATSVERSPPIPDAAYRAKLNDEFSLGHQFLQDLMQGTKSEMSTLRYLQTPVAWQAAVQCNGKWDDLQRLWLSMLACVGDLLTNPTLGYRTGWLVLRSTPFGCLCARMHLQYRGTLQFYEFAPCDDDDHPLFQLHCIHDVGDWHVVSYQARCPAWLAERGFQEVSVGKCLLVPLRGDPNPLVRHAAYAAFKGLTTPHLLKLIDVFSIPYEGAKPHLEAECARLCVSHFLPDFGEEELVDALAQRNMKKKQSGGKSVLTEEAAQMVEENCGEEDKDFVQDLRAEAKLPKEVAAAAARVKAAFSKKAQAGSTPNVPAKRAANSSASSSAAPAQSAFPALEDKAYSLAEARALMPKAKGATITVHESNHAWLARYPTDEFPKSRTISFAPGDPESISSALRGVLLWAWRHHVKQGGGRPSFDLGEAI